MSHSIAVGILVLLASAVLSDAAPVAVAIGSSGSQAAHPKGPQHHHRFGLLVKEKDEIVKPTHVEAKKKGAKPSHLLFKDKEENLIVKPTHVKAKKASAKPSHLVYQAHHDSKDHSKVSLEKHQTKPTKVAALIDAAPADDEEMPKTHHKGKKHHHHREEKHVDIVEPAAKPTDVEAHHRAKDRAPIKNYDKEARDEVRKMYFDEGQEMSQALKNITKKENLMRAEPKPATALPDLRIFTEVGQHAAEEERNELVDMSKIARFQDSLLGYYHLHKEKVPTDSANIYDPHIVPVATTTTNPSVDKHWRRHEHMPVDNLCMSTQCKEHADCNGRKGYGCHCSKAVNSRNCFDCRCGETRGIGMATCGPYSDAEMCSR